MPRITVICILLAGVLCAQADKGIAFSPQATSKHVTLWLAAGCPVKPVAAVNLAIVAAEHQITYVAPVTASDLLAKRSIIANIAKWGGVAASVITGMMSVKFIQARPAWIEAGAGVSTFLGIVVPMADKVSPAIRSDAGGDLSLGTNGCGTAWFYAVELKGQHPFVEAAQ